MKNLVKAMSETHGRIGKIVIKQVTLIDEALILKIDKRLTTRFPTYKITALLETLNRKEEIGEVYYAVETTKSEGSVTIVECDDRGQWHCSLESACDNEDPSLIEAMLSLFDIDDEQEDPMGSGSEPKVWP